MPVFRLRSLFFSLAAAALLASSLAAPVHAQVAFGHAYPVAWGYFAAPPYYAYYGHPWVIAFPGHARVGGWSIAGFPFTGGLHGAAGRLSLR